MSMKMMDIQPVQTSDQVHTTSTPPTWRAKDVGGNLPPRTPMGTEPLSGSAGGRRSRKERIETMHTRGLPSFGPHGCVKPYCCFVVCIVFLLESAGCYSTLELLVSLGLNGCPPLLRAHGASFYMLKGLPKGGSVGGGKNGKML